MEAENEKDTSRSEFQLKIFLSTNQNAIEMRKHIMDFKEQSEEKLELFQLFDKMLIYILYLIIKALRTYIARNSKTNSEELVKE